MKNFGLLLTGLVCLMFVSCGKDKEKSDESGQAASGPKPVKYKMILDATYEKDDQIKVVYKTEAFWIEDSPIMVDVTGNPDSQRIEIVFPDNIVIDNVKVFASHNKDQQYLKVHGMVIGTPDRQAFGNPALYYQYINWNDGVAWDEANQRLNLFHDKAFPPGFTGSEKLEELLLF